MLGLWNVEWLGLNAERNYPLTADSSGVDTSNSFTLPDDFLLELDVPVHAGMAVDPGRFFIKHVGAYATGYSVIVGYQPAEGDAINVASALIPRPTHIPNAVYALGGVGAFGDTVGKLVIGRLENIDAQPPGFWTFTLDTARLEPDAVRPIIRGVTALVCVNGDQRSVPLQGDVQLRGGANIQLSAVLVDGEDPVIVISAIAGAGTVETCVCAGDEAAATPIKTINGIHPTLEGNINLVGSDCIQIVPGANGLQIVDICAKPCCGCPELERITTDLERLRSEAVTVQGFVDRIQAEVSVMNTTVLGARLGRSCVQCS